MTGCQPTEDFSSHFPQICHALLLARRLLIMRHKAGMDGDSSHNCSIGTRAKANSPLPKMTYIPVGENQLELQIIGSRGVRVGSG